MGFSAGAELAAPAAVLYEDWDKKNNDPSDPFAGISSRPDFAGIIYPAQRPSPATAPHRPSPKTSAAFLVCASAVTECTPSGSRVLPGDADGGCPQCRDPPLRQRPPPRRRLARRQPHVRRPDRPQQHPVRNVAVSIHRLGRDLGFLEKPGIETKAAKDVAGYVVNPPRASGRDAEAQAEEATPPQDQLPQHPERRLPGPAAATDQHSKEMSTSQLPALRRPA